MFPVAQCLFTVPGSNELSLQRSGAAIQFIVTTGTSWAAIQPFVAGAETERQVTVVGEDNGVFVVVTDSIESDPAVLTPS